jgi:hypothetical protein
VRACVQRVCGCERADVNAYSPRYGETTWGSRVVEQDCTNLQCQIPQDPQAQKDQSAPCRLWAQHLMLQLNQTHIGTGGGDAREDGTVSIRAATTTPAPAQQGQRDEGFRIPHLTCPLGQRFPQQRCPWLAPPPAHQSVGGEAFDQGIMLSGIRDDAPPCQG